MSDKIHITDLNKLRLYKIKPWAIYFEYDGQKYLIHEGDDDYEYAVTLYKKNINEHGYYELEEIDVNLCYANFDKQFLRAMRLESALRGQKHTKNL